MSEKRNGVFFRSKPGILIALVTTGLLMLGAVGGSSAIAADDVKSAEELVDEAKETLKSFHADPELGWFHDHVQEAKAVLVIPGYVKGAFFAGAGGGRGVLMVKNQYDNSWSQPGFYTAGHLGVGLQFGIHVMETVVMVMTQEALDKFYETRFKIGGDISVTLGPKGGGIARTPSGDLLSFSRAKGVMIGFSLAGATIAVNNDYNKAFYGKSVTPKDIFTGKVSNPRATGLTAAVGGLEFFPVK